MHHRDDKDIVRSLSYSKAWEAGSSTSSEFLVERTPCLWVRYYSANGSSHFGDKIESQVRYLFLIIPGGLSLRAQE